MQGVHTLMDLLKYYGNLEDNQKILVEVEAKVMKCLAICLRSDRIVHQLLSEEKKNKYFLYIMDVAREQLAIIKDYKEDMLVSFSKHDVNLLLNCFFVFRQLLLISSPETKKCRPLI